MRATRVVLARHPLHRGIYGSRTSGTKLARSFQERYSVHFGADDWASLSVSRDAAASGEKKAYGISSPQTYYLRILMHHLIPPDEPDYLPTTFKLSPVTYARAKEDVPMENVGTLPLLKGEILELLDDADPNTWFGRSLRLESGTVPADKLEYLHEALDSAEQSRQAMYLSQKAIIDPQFTQAVAAPFVLNAESRVVELEEYLEETFNRIEKGRLVVSVSFVADGYDISGTRRIGEAFFGKAISVIVRVAQNLEPDMSFQYRVETLDVNDGQKLHEYPGIIRSAFNPMTWFRSSSRGM